MRASEVIQGIFVPLVFGVNFPCCEKKEICLNASKLNLIYSYLVARDGFFGGIYVFKEYRCYVSYVENRQCIEAITSSNSSD